jgi:hypothetical protein
MEKAKAETGVTFKYEEGVLTAYVIKNEKSEYAIED